MKATDQEILERIKRGDAIAFSELINRYKYKSMSLAMGILKNTQLAEEAVQDSFVKVYYALSKFEERAQFSTWLYRIVFNTTHTYLLKQKKHEENIVSLVRNEDDEEYIENHIFISEDKKTDEQVEEKEVSQFIQQAIESLPKKYQMILDLYFNQEFSIKEIMEITNLPEGTIKVNLYRGRMELKKYFDEKKFKERYQ